MQLLCILRFLLCAMLENFYAFSSPAHEICIFVLFVHAWKRLIWNTVLTPDFSQQQMNPVFSSLVGVGQRLQLLFIDQQGIPIEQLQEQRTRIWVLYFYLDLIGIPTTLRIVYFGLTNIPTIVCRPTRSTWREASRRANRVFGNLFFPSSHSDSFHNAILNTILIKCI